MKEPLANSKRYGGFDAGFLCKRMELSLQLWGQRFSFHPNKQQTHRFLTACSKPLSHRVPWAWWNIQYGDKIAGRANQPQEKKAVLIMLKSDLR